MKKIILGLVSLTIISSACKKDKEPPAITKENLAGTYTLVSDVRKNPGEPEIDMIANYYAECEKDNLTKIEANGNWESIDAGTVCDPALNGQVAWDLRTDSVFVAGYYWGVVSKFDGSTLAITDSWQGGEGTITQTVTMKKQ